jgi:hypothetical protein
MIILEVLNKISYELAKIILLDLSIICTLVNTILFLVPREEVRVIVSSFKIVYFLSPPSTLEVGKILEFLPFFN